MNTNDTLEIPLAAPSLSDREADDLQRCEMAIEEQHGGAEGVARALKEVKAKRLYRSNYRSFEQYVHRRLGWSTVKLEMALSNPALSWLRRVALAVKTSDEMSASAIYNLCDEHGIEIPGCRSADDDRGVKIVGTLLARCFREGDKIELDGVTVEKFITTEYKPDRQANVAVKRYTFKK